MGEVEAFLKNISWNYFIINIYACVALKKLLKGWTRGKGNSMNFISWEEDTFIGLNELLYSF